MNLLPLGSVILLKDGQKRLMNFGIKQVNNDDQKTYDYIGCLYPEGHIGQDHLYLFNHEDIEKIEFVGFVDSEFQVFRAKVEEELKKVE